MKKLIYCLTNDIVYDRRVLRSVNALKESFEVQVICRKLHKQSTLGTNVNIKRFSCLFHKGFWFYCEFNIRLFFKLLFAQFDYLVAVDYDTALPVIAISNLRNKKAVLDAHEYFEESIEIVRRKRVKKFWEWVGAYTMRKFQDWFTVSESIAKQFNEKYSVPFKVVRNLPYRNTTAPVQSFGERNKKIILYQGVLNEGRKLELLIDTVMYLSNEFEIWIIGEGDISEKLKEQVQRLQLEKKILFFSWIEPSKLASYTVQAYLCYNLLSDNSISYYYSLANKFFDYIQAGVPSLNSPFPEYIRYKEKFNCCYLTDHQDPKEFAQFISKLDPIEYKNIKKNAIDAAKTLCWENESIKLVSIFHNLHE